MFVVLVVEYVRDEFDLISGSIVDEAFGPYTREEADAKAAEYAGQWIIGTEIIALTR